MNPFVFSVISHAVPESEGAAAVLFDSPDVLRNCTLYAAGKPGAGPILILTVTVLRANSRET